MGDPQTWFRRPKNTDKGKIHGCQPEEAVLVGPRIILLEIIPVTDALRPLTIPSNLRLRIERHPGLQMSSSGFRNIIVKVRIFKNRINDRPGWKMIIPRIIVHVPVTMRPNPTSTDIDIRHPPTTAARNHHQHQYQLAPYLSGA